MPKVLVAYGSKNGGTAEIAEWIGDALREQGIDAQVASAKGVKDVRPYDAVIIGGALYAGLWHKHARNFARRHRQALRDRPVWLFSSGPLDWSAGQGDLEQAKSVVKVADDLGARGEISFGGVLTPDAHGFIASSMAKKMSGDYRDPARVLAWTLQIAAELSGAKL